MASRIVSYRKSTLCRCPCDVPKIHALRWTLYDRWSSWPPSSHRVEWSGLCVVPDRWLNSIPPESFYSAQCSQQPQLNTIFTCDSTSTKRQLFSSPNSVSFNATTIRRSYNRPIVLRLDDSTKITMISDQGLRKVRITRRDDSTEITMISDHIESDLDALTILRWSRVFEDHKTFSRVLDHCSKSLRSFDRGRFLA